MKYETKSNYVTSGRRSGQGRSLQPKRRLDQDVSFVSSIIESPDRGDVDVCGEVRDDLSALSWR